MNAFVQFLRLEGQQPGGSDAYGVSSPGELEAQLLPEVSEANQSRLHIPVYISTSTCLVRSSIRRCG